MSSELGVERPTTLALPESRVERRVHFSDVAGPQILINEPAKEHMAPSPKKIRADSEFRYKRKRSYSFSGTGEFRNKRRKNNIVLPSKFLLGGTISDPLNLGSLDKEEIAKLGEDEGAGGTVSKRSDAVRVIIPPNINDPLNLDASSDNEDTLTDALQKQLRRNRRRRGKRKRRLSEPGGSTVEGTNLDIDNDAGQVEEEDLPERIHPMPLLERSMSVDAMMKPLTVNTEFTAPLSQIDARREGPGPVTPTGSKPSTSGVARQPFKKQRTKSDNKIVSPVIPQPGVERKRHPSHSRHYADKPHLSQQNLVPPKKYNPKNEHFQYGNYNKYYGYRNPDQTPDIRLDYLRREWFEGKEVLDIGCNIGHITLTVARDFAPKRVVGIDIDKKLVNIAQKNIKHYHRKSDAQEANFPKSMKLLYGPLKPPVKADGNRSFPYNVKFVHANYVLESDELLETVRPEFDLILCLSVTKWVHLNWGDKGLKRFFRRAFLNLRPGGRLVLEPQGWPSYSKRRKLTEKIFDNYKNIRLFPEKFNDYLLHEVGFSTSEKMATPHHTSRGFQRPIIVYTKAGCSTKSSPALEAVSAKQDVRMKAQVVGEKKKKEVAAEEKHEVDLAAAKTMKRASVEPNIDSQGVKKLKVECEYEEQRHTDIHVKSDQRNPSSHQTKAQTSCSDTGELQKMPNTIEHSSQESGSLVTVTKRQDNSVLEACDASFCDTVINNSTGNKSLASERGSCIAHSPSSAQSNSELDKLPYTSVRNADDPEKCIATSKEGTQTVDPPTPSVCHVNISDASSSRRDKDYSVCNSRTLPTEDSVTVIDSCKVEKTEVIDSGLECGENNRHNSEKMSSVCSVKSVDKETPIATENIVTPSSEHLTGSPRSENNVRRMPSSPLKENEIEAEEKDFQKQEDKNKKRPREAEEEDDEERSKQSRHEDE